MFPYEPEIEQSMKDYFETLSEKDKRRYAGIETLKLDRGGITYIAELLGIRRKTVVKGMKEVINLSAQEKSNKRIRKKGGGRKRYDEQHADIDQKFQSLTQLFMLPDVNRLVEAIGYLSALLTMP